MFKNVIKQSLFNGNYKQNLDDTLLKGTCYVSYLIIVYSTYFLFYHHTRHKKKISCLKMSLKYLYFYWVYKQNLVDNISGEHIASLSSSLCNFYTLCHIIIVHINKINCLEMSLKYLYFIEITNIVWMIIFVRNL